MVIWAPPRTRKELNFQACRPDVPWMQFIRSYNNPHKSNEFMSVSYICNDLKQLKKLANNLVVDWDSWRDAGDLIGIAVKLRSDGYFKIVPRSEKTVQIIEAVFRHANVRCGSTAEIWPRQNQPASSKIDRSDVAILLEANVPESILSATVRSQLA